VKVYWVPVLFNVSGAAIKCFNSKEKAEAFIRERLRCQGVAVRKFKEIQILEIEVG